MQFCPSGGGVRPATDRRPKLPTPRVRARCYNPPLCAKNQERTTDRNLISANLRHECPAARLPAGLLRFQRFEVLANNPNVPVARLGRLAVDEKFRGRKLGAAMLWDAISRAARSEVVVYGVVVDAKDDEAIAFYEHHGFFMLSAGTRQLILPIASVAEHETKK